MRKTGWLALLLIPGFLSTLLPAQAPAAGDAISVQAVKYDGLADAVREKRGKVIVVDFWSTTCIPCMREFHNLVELSRQYGPEQFAAISVSVDDPNKPGVPDKVRAFLERQDARFTNLILNESPEVWQPRLKISAVPCVYVFDREGRISVKYSDEVDYELIKQRVAQLIRP